MSAIEAVEKSLAIADKRGEPYVCATVELKREDLREVIAERAQYDEHIADCLEALTAAGAEGHDVLGDVTIGIDSLVQQRDAALDALREARRKVKAFVEEGRVDDFVHDELMCVLDDERCDHNGDPYVTATERERDEARRERDEARAELALRNGPTTTPVDAVPVVHFEKPEPT